MAESKVYYQCPDGSVDYVRIDKNEDIIALKSKIKERNNDLPEPRKIDIYQSKGCFDAKEQAPPFRNIKKTHSQNPTKTLCAKMFVNTVVATCF